MVSSLRLIFGEGNILCLYTLRINKIQAKLSLGVLVHITPPPPIVIDASYSLLGQIIDSGLVTVEDICTDLDIWLYSSKC